MAATVTPALMNTYARSELAFERGEGAYLITADGRRYLDFASGIAVTALGHCHPHLVKTLAEQAGKLWHVSNLYRIPDQERLADRLVANSFADQVFFGNSGAEAVECGLKLIRKWQDDFGDPKRYRVIGCEGSFHGRTLATLAAAGNEKYLKGYAPDVDGFDQVPFGNLNELRQKIGPETAGILVEPVQGEGGMRAGSVEYLRGLRQVCDEYGLLLMFDEVQAGMGRTGKLFAHEWAGITPDIVATAKGIGAGFPMGACLATNRVAAAFGPGNHGTTFGGNPLAMAVGNAVLDVMLAPGFMEHVVAMGDRLAGKLDDLIQRHPAVYAERRGKDLIQGLKCHLPNTDLVEKLRGAGLLTVGAGDNVIRLLPPLIISETEIDLAARLLGDVAAEAKAA
ncbi:aspartate aminotransferase family protein [Dongia soli]|uniref:Acetylornithine aminotransferase n=1 Tax=Dongia soli TaxID=600628 RepID=A0ABU5E9K3_9PROT|nr:aspartate aminotransferase family protein [Dongia soli]MDY0882228.1 aspartate aminotransferase family protein [Dongia soli]